MSSDIERRGGRSPEETFAILGHETRLAILYELWDTHDPKEFGRDPLSFTELRTRVGMRDPGQFHYHLTQLVGPFVRHTDDGYVIRHAGEQIVSTMLAGALTDEVVFDAEPIDDPCPLCGGQVVLDHGTDRAPDELVTRCTACDGAWKTPGYPSGMLGATPVLRPAGVRDRSLPEMYRAQDTWDKYRIMSMIEGVCPRCSGPVTATPLICEAHAVSDGQVCPHCDTIFEIRFRHVCDVCKGPLYAPTGRHILIHPTVAAFYHDHGYDDAEAWGTNWLRLETETIVDQTAVAEDPLEIEVTVVVDDDQLAVTLDDEGTVVDVQI